MFCSTILRRQVLVLLCVALAGFVGLLAPATVGADTFLVINLNDSGPGSLRAEINAANGAPGSTINFQNGLTGTINLNSASGPLAITAGVTINGPGASLITVNGGNLITDITVGPSIGGSVTISGITISGGHAPGTGGGVDIDVNTIVILNNDVISGNTSNSDAGGLFINTGATVTVNNSTLSGNTTAPGTHVGGAADVYGTLTFNGSVLSFNGGGFGGGVNVNSFGTLIVNNSEFDGNIAITQGGGINDFGGTVTIENSTFFGNNVNGAGDSGGGIYNTNGTVTVLNSTFNGNQANGANSTGGGVSIAGGSGILINDTISGNSVSGSNALGGGLYRSSGTLSVTNSIIAGNTGVTIGVDVNGNVISGGHNAIGKTDGSSGWGGTDLTGNNGIPLSVNVKPLQDNGGNAPQTDGSRPKTGAPKLPDGTHPRTMAIDNTSPAFRAGNGTTCTTAYPNGANSQDERGPAYPRSAGACSIGAFEPQVPPPTPTGLHVTGATYNSLTWGWTNPDPTASLIFTVDGTHFFGLAAGTTTFTLYAIAYGFYGCMRIAAYNVNGASLYTPYSCKHVVPLNPYGPHQTESTTSTGTISWTNYDTYSYEQVYDYSEGMFHQVGQNGTTYTLTNIPAGTYHCAAVQAYNVDYASGLAYACPFAQPNAPTNVHAKTVSPTQVTFIWTAPDAYSWYYVYDPSVGHVVSGTSYTTTNITVSGGHGYACVYVAAGGYGGTSAYVLRCDWAY